MVGKKKKRKRIFIKTLILLVLIAGFIMLFKYGFFDIKRIYINGVSIERYEQVLDLCKVSDSTNIFSYNTDEAISRILDIVQIKKIYITKNYPNTLYVSVLERYPYVAFQIEDHYLIYDEDGININTVDSLNDVDGLLVTGFDDNDDLNCGNNIDYSSDATLTTVNYILQWAQKNQLNGYITELYHSESGYYYAYTTSSNVIKFYSLNAFINKEQFIKSFLLNEKRNIMVEVIEDSEPVYKVININ